MTTTPAAPSGAPVPMDPWVQELFESEVEEQCRFVLFSADQINEALRAQKNPRESLLWYWMQNLLVSAANISKLLWGTEATVADRASLRANLGIDDSATMVIRSRHLRNDFEHFDERLAKRFTDPARPRVFLGRNVGPKARMVQMPGLKDDDWFQHFDPSTGTVSFWDRKVDLNALVLEVVAIHGAVLARRAGPFGQA